MNTEHVREAVMLAVAFLCLLHVIAYLTGTL